MQKQMATRHCGLIQEEISNGCVRLCVCVSAQLVVIAFDDGELVKENRTQVEITVLQPSRIPIFTEEEYR